MARADVLKPAAGPLGPPMCPHLLFVVRNLLWAIRNQTMGSEPKKGVSELRDNVIGVRVISLGAGSSTKPVGENVVAQVGRIRRCPPWIVASRRIPSCVIRARGGVQRIGTKR